MTDATPLLDARGLVKRYGGLVATDGVDFRLPAGETCGVIGPNGAGKSTLIGLLGGALRPTAGRIIFAGRDVTALPAADRARAGIGRTYQIPRPFLDMTVEENLQVAQMSRDAFRSGPAAREDRLAILRRCGLADSAAVPARSLPLLSRKRLEIARALALDPRLLLLDEVGAGLVDSEVTELIALVRSLTAPDRSIVIIEHVMRVVKECCPRVAVIDFGRKIADGPTHDVLASDEVAAVYLGTQRGSAGRDARQPSRSARPAAARFDALIGPRASTGRDEVLLRLDGISAGYGQARVLHGIDLSVRSGETVAILGTNGAGKTTLASVIGGGLRPTAGRVTFAGRDITAEASHQRVAAGIAHCMEGRRIFPTLSVEENLAVACRSREPGDLDRRLAQVYGLFPELAQKRGSPGTDMSGGQQQMLAIGRALMARPRLVIFDEISLGLAPVMMDRLYDALRELRAAGLTMLIVEQDVARTLAIADVAFVIDRGRWVMSGAASQLSRNPRLRQLYVGGPR